ncbi:Uncharacterised protein [Streptococcus pneumoniae]|nr:Uncharacterised protein [Streptococcus pneumoniae]
MHSNLLEFFLLAYLSFLVLAYCQKVQSLKKAGSFLYQLGLSSPPKVEFHLPEVAHLPLLELKQETFQIPLLLQS